MSTIINTVNDDLTTPVDHTDNDGPKNGSEEDIERLKNALGIGSEDDDGIVEHASSVNADETSMAGYVDVSDPEIEEPKGEDMGIKADGRHEVKILNGHGDGGEDHYRSEDDPDYESESEDSDDGSSYDSSDGDLGLGSEWIDYGEM